MQFLALFPFYSEKNVAFLFLSLYLSVKMRGKRCFNQSSSQTERAWVGVPIDTNFRHNSLYTKQLRKLLVSKFYFDEYVEANVFFVNSFNQV